MSKSNIDELEAKCVGFKKERGAVLYSDVRTLSERPIYLLGYNPGGDPNKNQTIEENLSEAKNKSKGKVYWSDYVDSDWGKGEGEKPLQERLRELIDHCYGVESMDKIREVFGTNLIFHRSKNYAGVDSKLADTFWPIHEWLIKSIIRPRVIITIGNGQHISAYQYLKNKWGDGVEKTDVYRGNIKLKTFSVSTKELHLQVVGLPHLSRYATNEKMFKWCQKYVTKYLEGK